MKNAWPYISFLLGGIFALVLQWVSYRLSFKKDQRKEYWIRKLNSYQDFYQQSTQLIKLLDSNVSIPESIFWQSISLARKAAYDATFYDSSHPERTERMKAITLDLIKLYKSDEKQAEILNSLVKQIDGVIEEFHVEEKLLTITKRQPQNLKYVQEDQDFDGIFIWTLILSGFITGIVYIALFLPLTWHSAKNIGLDPIDVILFAQLPPNLTYNFFNLLAPAWTNLEVRPILYSLGILYGVTGVVLAYMLFSFKRSGLINLAVTAGGLVWGYFLTIYLAGDVFRIIQIDSVTQKMFRFKIAYILLVYYFFEGLKELIKGKDLLRKKYEMFYDGMFGIVSTLLLLKGFDINVMSILTGPLFLSCTFLTTLVAEQTVGRLYYGFIEFAKWDSEHSGDVPPTKLKAKIELIKMALTVLWQKIKEYKGQEIEVPFLPTKMWAIIKQSSKRSLILIPSFIGFVCFSIFPILALTIYHLTVEGHF